VSSIHYTLADPVYNRYRNQDPHYRDISHAFAACASACTPFKNSPGTYATCCKQHAANAPPKPAPISSRFPAGGPTPVTPPSKKKSGSKSSKTGCTKACKSFAKKDPTQCTSCCAAAGGDQTECDTCCGTTSTSDTTGTTTDTGTTDTTGTDTTTTEDTGTTTTETGGATGSIFDRMYQSICCGGGGGGSTAAPAYYAYQAQTLYNVGEEGYLDNWENYDPSEYGDTNYYDYGYPSDNTESYFAYASKKKSTSSSSKKKSGTSGTTTDTSGTTTDTSGTDTTTKKGKGKSTDTTTTTPDTTTTTPDTTTTTGGGSCSGGIPFVCDDQGKFTMVIVLAIIFLLVLSMKGR
jgi:hypothetical protein